MIFTVTESRDISVKNEDPGSVFKGVLLSFIATLPFFTHGLQTTALYSSTHGGHFISSSEAVPWNATALIVAAIVTAPLYALLIDKFGRIVGIFLVVFFQGATCLPLYLDYNEITVYILHVLAGVSAAGLFTVLPTYVVEINAIPSKGLSLSLIMLMATVGYLMKVALEQDVILYLMTALVVAQLISLFVLIESPGYLVKSGKTEKAISAIFRLRCLKEDNLTVLKELQSLKDESSRAKVNGKLNLITIQKNLIWRDATKISILLTTTMVLCGSIVFLDQDKTLMQLRMGSDPDKVVVLVGMCAGSLFTVMLVKFIEKKYLLTVGYITMVLAMGVLAVYTQIDLTVTSERWLPVWALGLLVYGYGISWCLPTIIAVEMFNFEIRATMIGALFSYAQIIKLVQLHCYQYIEDYMGVYTLFYIFAGINLYGGVYGMFVIPDFKGKTLRQVEKQLKRIPLLKM